jgi:hypothetical protein
MLSQLDDSFHSVVHTSEVNFVAKQLSYSLHVSLLLDMVLVQPFRNPYFNILVAKFVVVFVLRGESL